MILDRHSSRATESVQSASATALSRRRFLQVGTAAGGGLLLTLILPSASDLAEAAGANGFVPNAFIRIEGDGQIVLTMPYVEMGQGTYTAIPMLIAEELEVGLKQVRLECERDFPNPAIELAVLDEIRSPVSRHEATWIVRRQRRTCPGIEVARDLDRL